MYFLDMSPYYPFQDKVKNICHEMQYLCNKGIALFSVNLEADLPGDCSLVFYADEQPPLVISHTNRRKYTLNFTAQNLTTTFNRTACDYDSYSGFSLVIEANYIVPTNNEVLGPNYSLIVGISSGGFVLVCFVVIVSAIYFVKKRQKWYNRIYKILKEMNVSENEIAEMKSKSHELLIKPGRNHINFDMELGRGVSSTVYKGFLMGLAPLHKILETENDRKFSDCDVAVKCTHHFGQSEVEKFFKEIDVMKAIGYHTNVMCMLGWALSGDVPCMVFEIAEKDLLGFVTEYEECPLEQIPYDKFKSILLQITQGLSLKHSTTDNF